MTRSKFYRISSIQGHSLDNCFVMVERSPYEDFKDVEMNTWVLIHLSKDSIVPLVSGAGDVSSLWVSPKGVVYLIATHEQGYGLHIGQPTSTGYEWQWQVITHQAHTYVTNVWGLSEEIVFVWGGGVLSPDAYPDPATRPNMDDPYCWLKQRDGWHTYPTPGWIYTLHGRDPLTITAVGNRGLAARWQTDHWESLLSPPIDLGFVQVTPSLETYGASYYGKLFTYLPSSGWKRIGADLGFITGLASWKNEIFILLSQGLFRLEGERPVLIHPSVYPQNLIAGDSLLWNDDVHLYEWSTSGDRRLACSTIFASTEKFVPSN
ncbi:MAG: hypothetical protein KBD65_04130 [Candidatus Moranbacteria bacterium]|nr:hypothetical protein [Candidatus Moranbacteria bacterium]